MADVSVLNPYLVAALVAAGIVTHFLKRLYDLEQTGTIMLPTTFVKQRPYAFALAIAGAYLLAALCYFTNQLTYGMAILIGVVCSDAFDTLRARAVGAIMHQQSESK
jgi:hypothetical protein